jgi:hypothetical protein
MSEAARRDYEVLKDGWNVLFPDEAPLIDTTHVHIPPALSQLLDRVLVMFNGHIDDIVAATMEEEPERNPMAVGWAITMGFTKDLAVKSFRLGQYISKELPYDELTPCPCVVICDDEIEELLGEEGE